MNTTDQSERCESLRSLADKRSLLIGAAVDMKPLATDPRYAESLGREFNAVVGENIFKPHHIWAGPGTYNFDQADRLAQFARDNGMKLRGHTLVWHQSIPTWLQAERRTPEDVGRLLKEYIHAVVGRYRGQVIEWDVVNEAISDDEAPGYREASFWYETLGPGYVEQAFQWAHEADPDVPLYYNDYEAEDMGPKSDAVYGLVQDLVKNGVPIHGVGLQSHQINGWRATGENRQNIRRITDLGLTWAVTECEFRIELKGNPPTGEQLNMQAAGYADLMELCLTEPNCRGFLAWGFTDAHSWIPGFRKGWGAALPLDENYQPKPAYHALQQTLRG